MDFKAEIMDETAMKRSLSRITHEIIERNRGTDRLMLVGIKRRGVPLAKMIADNILRFEGAEVPVGYLDITQYRDDIDEMDSPAHDGDTMIPCDVSDMRVILVDDVMYTGRTVRAAIECIFTFGRPASIQLAVLIDRGHRELPLRPDFVGRNIPTAKTELVSVHVPEVDGEMCVRLCDAEKR